MALRRVTLPEFLQHSNAGAPDLLPLVHTTQGHNLFDIINARRLVATDCDVFEGVKLCYMFLGRPAYKVRPSDDPLYWELPIAFVTKFPTVPQPKRVFPFDSGAFRRSLLPRSITAFPIENFNMSGDNSLISRFIAVFYGSNEAFYKGKAYSTDRIREEHIIGVEHMEVEAAISLHQGRLTGAFDDRAKSIELQYSEDIEFRQGDLLAIILPEQYRQSLELDAAMRDMSCEVRYYDTYPLRVDAYYAQIYDITNKIIKKYADD